MFKSEDLKNYIRRIEAIDAEKEALSEDSREVYREAKAHGLDTKILREIIKLRKMQPYERAQKQEMLELYQEALGM